MNTNIILCHGSVKPIKQQTPQPAAHFPASEIRNPLCNIYLACDVLSLTSLDPEQQLCLGIIMRASARINNLVSTILDLLKAGEKGTGLYTLRQLVEEVLMTMNDQLATRQIEVTTDYASSEDKLWLNAPETKAAMTKAVADTINTMPTKGGALKLITRSAGDSSTIEIQSNGSIT